MEKEKEDKRLKFLSKEELQLIRLMRLGQEITGTEIADEAINFFIDNCIKHKKTSN